MDIITTDTVKRDVWDYWPMDSEMRDTQKRIFEWVSNQPSYKKYLMCEVPVGGGKSPIALTLAGYFGQGNGIGSSYILTPQRILQRQYEESFRDQHLTSVYGKGNYFCTHPKKKGMTCDLASDIKIKKDCTGYCEAKKAFASIKSTPHVVLNYKLALLYSELLPGDAFEDFPMKDMMVFDECHTLESHLVDHRAVSISEHRCKYLEVPFPIVKTLQDAHTWLVDTYEPRLLKEMADLNEKVRQIDRKYENSDDPHFTPEEIRIKRDYREYERHKRVVQTITHSSYEYLYEHYVLVNEKNKFMFKEIYGANLFHRILKPKAERFLFMSGTILNFDQYAKDIGLDIDEVATISVDSEFDPDNRPVYFHPVAKMSYGWDKKPEVTANMKSKVVELCNAYGDQSGIIHTGSFHIANWLINEIKDEIPHRIISHTPNDSLGRDGAVDEFIHCAKNEPVVLISPSMTEGLDLKDDLGRFSIFVKIPYMSLGDAWVKRRLDISNTWYQLQAMIHIIQGGGRVTRGPDDWGDTHILDSSFYYLWNQIKRFVPKWWKDAFTIVK